MSLNERGATLRSPGHHRQGSGDRSEEVGRLAMQRAGSGVVGGSDIRELHERTITVRSNAASPEAVSMLL